MADFHPFRSPSRGFRVVSEPAGPRLVEDLEPPEPEPVLEPEPPPAPEPVVPAADLDELLDAARKAGRAEATAELEPQIAELQGQLGALDPLLDEVRALRRHVLERAALDVGALVEVAARQVIGESLALHPGALSHVMKEAIARLPEAEQIWVAVPPGLAESLSRQVRPELRAHILADPSVGEGCVVRTRYASIEVSVQTAAEGIAAAVKDWVAEQPWTVDW